MGYKDYLAKKDKLNEKLKKCVICGSRPYLTHRGVSNNFKLPDNLYFTVDCSGCSATTDKRMGSVDYENAISDWNEDLIIIKFRDIARYIKNHAK